jgi:hypothetical protein
MTHVIRTRDAKPIHLMPIGTPSIFYQCLINVYAMQALLNRCEFTGGQLLLFGKGVN